MSRREVLSDGQPVLIRPLLYGDRFELAAGFTELSPRSRRHRFFNAPAELDDDELEYLTNLDYRDHFACAAVLEDRPVPKGVGVARYVREDDDPTTAEVAVTVLDAYQRRGIGTLLTRTLGEVAAENGIRSFVNYVQWENAAAIELLTDEESRITSAEPGVARIEVDLPARVAEVPDSYLHRVISAYAGRVREMGRLFGAEPAPPQHRPGRGSRDGAPSETRAPTPRTGRNRAAGGRSVRH
jgi:ribosomal protein S18 acetylase RimI-like enzyme